MKETDLPEKCRIMLDLMMWMNLGTNGGEGRKNEKDVAVTVELI